MAIDSFKKRYFYKLTTNLLNFFIAFLTVGIIPRALGVDNYGNYAYINNIFSQIIVFIEFRTSTCYYVKLSQNQSDKKITLFYFSYALILFFILTVISLILINIKPLNNFVFGANSMGRLVVFVLFLTAFFTWFTDIVSSALDALGYTVYLEKIKIVNRLISALSIFSLFYLHYLNLNTLVILQVTLGIFIILLLVQYLRKKYSFDKEKLNTKEFINYSTIFYKYSFPLLGYLLLQFIGNIFDRWYLQHESGSFQQGLYSFSYSLMSFCYLFINAFQPLITREFSMTAASNEKAQMSLLFQKFNSILFAVTGYLCAYIFVEAYSIVEFFGGNKYITSGGILQILMLYPLISTYSLLNGAVLYSTEKTKLLFKISFVLTPVGILLTFFLLNKTFGLSLGSTGLAIKNILGDLISVIIILYLNSKYLNFSFLKTASHFLYIIVFLGVAYLSHAIVHFVPAGLFLKILISGSIYSLIIIFLLFFFPKFLGVSDEMVGTIKNKIYEYYNKWFSSSKTN
jgi:O-antigen/teichoic acid export membrane protein